MIAGVLLFLAPLWFWWNLTLPEFRTVSFGALASGVTLYGGVLAGIFVAWRLKANRPGAITGRAVSVAAMVGAALAIVLAMGAWAFLEPEPGGSWRQMPILLIPGGIVIAVVAGGAGLVAYALHPSRS
ncbi:MAG TPA: hypothetical protein VMN38_07310 [Sphingomicrobium sp.]|nr:hypothetical protein [Sphingomicrobium sp.]